MGAHPDVNPAGIPSPEPHGRARTHRFGKRGGQAGLQNSHPSPRRGERRWGAGSKLGSGLGREHLVKTLMQLVGMNPGGKETAKEDRYGKDWEHGVPSGPGCDSTHRVRWGAQTYGPLRWSCARLYAEVKTALFCYFLSFSARPFVSFPPGASYFHKQSIPGASCPALPQGLSNTSWLDLHHLQIWVFCSAPCHSI